MCQGCLLHKLCLQVFITFRISPTPGVERPIAIDQAGQHRIDPDTILTQGLGQCSGQAVQPGLGSAVSNGAAAGGLTGNAGCHHHTPPSGLFQQGYRCAGHVKGAHEIDTQCLQPDILGQTFQIIVGYEGGGARIVDQNIQAAELGYRPLHQPLAVSHLTDIPLHSHSTATNRSSLCNNSLSTGPGRSVIDHHIHTHLGTAQGTGGANAGTGTGNQHGLAGRLHRFISIRLWAHNGPDYAVDCRLVQHLCRPASWHRML